MQKHSAELMEALLMPSPGCQLTASPGCVLRTADSVVQAMDLLSPDLAEDDFSKGPCSLCRLVCCTFCHQLLLLHSVQSFTAAI